MKTMVLKKISDEILTLQPDTIKKNLNILLDEEVFSSKNRFFFAKKLSKNQETKTFLFEFLNKKFPNNLVEYKKLYNDDELVALAYKRFLVIKHKGDVNKLKNIISDLEQHLSKKVVSSALDKLKVKNSFCNDCRFKLNNSLKDIINNRLQNE